MTAQLSQVELLRRLVAFDTTSANSNLPLVDFVCEYLDRPGVRLKRNPSPDGRKANLVIAVGPATDTERRGLLLSGHTDVVPAEEPGWVTDPFSLTRRNGTLVGRGACDMKGFLALAMNQVAALAPERLSHPLVLLFTYDEEIGTLGAKHFTETWSSAESLPRAAIIGEPTSLRAIRMHKGYLEMRVVVTGQAAHSGYPHLGRNAIEPVGQLIGALAALRSQLEHEGGPHMEFFPDVPYAALNVGRINGGTAVNIIPDTCVLEFGIRPLPGMNTAALAKRVEQTIQATLAKVPFRFEIGSNSPPLLLEEHSDIYRTLCAEIGQQETVSASYATDAGWLQSIDIDCVIFGPGSIEVAHQPNEFIPTAELERGGLLLERMIHHRCLTEA